jgi:hypothetical protein
MSGKWRSIGAGTAVAMVTALLLSGIVAASGSGYNQSYSQTPTNSNTAVGLTAVSSTYTSGAANLTASFSVAGTIDLTTSDYLYAVWFGGTAESNFTAEAYFTNNTTAGFYVTASSVGGEFGVMHFTLSNSGSTLTFSIATALVGPASNFAIDAYALYSTRSSVQYSWLGTYYSHSGGGSGSCGSSGCTGSSSSGSSTSSFGGAVLYGIIGVVIVVVVVVAVLLLVMRRRRPPTAAPAPMQAGTMPPSTLGTAPPPPSGAPMPPPPPPQGQP